MSSGRLLLALLAAVALGACGDDEAGSFGPPYAFPDSGEASAHPYSSFEGTELFEFAANLSAPGERNCALRFALEGSPLALDPACEGCLFSFQVSATLDTAGSFDDGSCAELGEREPFTYAVAADYYGDGSDWLLHEYRNLWYPVAEGVFEGDTFTYAAGYTDYEYVGTYGYYPDYAGTFQTWYLAGVATVR